MGWESSGVVRFDLGPLLPRQTRIPKLKSAYNSLFIVLIHPIQWTIALPVGATGPATRQKKTAGPVSSVHSLGGASYLLPV